MGKFKNTGIAHGTSGSTQTNLEQATLNIKIEEIIKKDMIQILLDEKVKFNENEVIFITKDKTGQIIWLEEGNSTFGLYHIVYGNGSNRGHKLDFEKAFNIKESEIPKFLNSIMSNGKVISNKLKCIGTRQGYERMYEYNGKYIVVSGIGTNGCIISAYPRRK